MQSTFTTERLCLTRLTAAPRASREFTWLHELFSDERAALWRYGNLICPSAALSSVLFQNTSTQKQNPQKKITEKRQRERETN